MTRIDKVLQTMVRTEGPIEWLYEETSRERLRLEQEREAFEEWYVVNAFDYPRNPIGSRECSLQWEAWMARAKGDFN